MSYIPRCWEEAYSLHGKFYLEPKVLENFSVDLLLQLEASESGLDFFRNTVPVNCIQFSFEKYTKHKCAYNSPNMGLRYVAA